LGVGYGAVAGCSPDPTDAPSDAAARLEDSSSAGSTTTTTAPAEAVSIERVASMARRADVELIIIRPAGIGGRLPTCLALHARGSGARMYLDLGMPALLNAAVAQVGRPFAMVAVDGGDSYWVPGNTADDPQRMLLEDMPNWLDNRGLARTPFAAIGIAMGAYGALNYARHTGLTAVGAISPALYLSWDEASASEAFTTQKTWEDTEPLRHIEEIGDVPLGVWCGTDDTFIRAARRLVDTAKPKVADLGNGDHNANYWERVLPAALRFVGDHITAS
jgi:S-formylglutathione hydrolase FrmB